METGGYKYDLGGFGINPHRTFDGDRRDYKKEIRALLEYEPSLNNAEIGKALSISRQLVWYHAKDMNLHGRTSPGRSCINCNKRIKSRNDSGMCRACWIESHAYEFVCRHCGKINVVYGIRAASRRRNASPKEFCNKSCSAKHQQKVYKTDRAVDVE